ncbi:putative gibberellin 2-beta-dioxygenase [Helianthus debilis subsp. tardiflorus]
MQGDVPATPQTSQCNNYNSHILLHNIPQNKQTIMALSRIKGRLTSSSSAQPPSPMPNPRVSSRSDPPFNNYADKLKNIPEFDLPDDMNRLPVADVEYRLIKAKDKNSIQKMLDSAVKFGMFQVSGHGISPEELNAAFTEAEFCFGLLAERWSRDGDREEFAWSRSAMVAAQRRKEVKNDQQFHMFRQKMDNIAKKLEGVAKDVAQIIASNGGKKPRKKIKENEIRMTLFKHCNSSLQPHTPRSCQTPSAMDGPRRDSATFALGLHIPTDCGEFRLLSDDGPYSFRAYPSTIVFTIGEQMQEWSYGEFRSVFGEINIEPDIQDEKGAYSIELKCSPTILNEAVDKNDSISITDQIIFVVVVAIVYKLFTYLLS